MCQEMLSEFRNAVSCRKSSHSRRRRPLGSAGGGVLRQPSRLALAAPRPIRLVRDMRFSNGKLYGGASPLSGALRGVGGANLGPGPQKLLEEPVCVNATGSVLTSPPQMLVAPPPPMPVAPPPPMLVAPPTLPRGFLQGCSHVRICQECRRIQNLRPRALTPPPPPPPSSSSSTSSCSRVPPSVPHHRPCLHRHLHQHHGSMSLPRLPPPSAPSPTGRADSDGGGTGSPRRGVKLPPPPRPMPPPKTPPRPPTDLLEGRNGTAEGRGFKPSQI